MTTTLRAVTALALLGAVTVLGACTSGTASSVSTSAPASTAAAAPSTAAGSHSATRAPRIVPAPGGGNIHQHIPSGTRHTKAPIAVNHTASFGSGVTARIAGHATINAKGRGPGEISGPATELTIVLTNHGTRAVHLSDAIVNVVDVAGSPLLSLSGPPAHALSGTLPARASARGTYVFALRGAHHGPFTISISYSTAAPVVEFIGALS